MLKKQCVISFLLNLPEALFAVKWYMNICDKNIKIVEN